MAFGSLHQIQLIALFFLISGCSKPVPEHLHSALARPAQKDETALAKKLTEWSLSLNGVPFEGNHHTLRIDDRVAMTGHAKLIKESLPSMVLPQLLVTLRPLDFDEDAAWDGTGKSKNDREFGGVIIHDQVDRKPKLDGRYFEPGEYNARLYYFIQDPVGENSSAELLAKATVTIVEGAEVEEPAK